MKVFDTVLSALIDYKKTLDDAKIISGRSGIEPEESEYVKQYMQEANALLKAISDKLNNNSINYAEQKARFEKYSKNTPNPENDFEELQYEFKRLSERKATPGSKLYEYSEIAQEVILAVTDKIAHYVTINTLKQQNLTLPEGHTLEQYLDTKQGRKSKQYEDDLFHNKNMLEAHVDELETELEKWRTEGLSYVMSNFDEMCSNELIQSKLQERNAELQKQNREPLKRLQPEEIRNIVEADARAELEVTRKDLAFAEKCLQLLESTENYVKHKFGFSRESTSITPEASDQLDQMHLTKAREEARSQAQENGSTRTKSRAV